jgi:succinate dehydrogenase / fumarate reductase cytochrome b subunit
MTRDPSHATPLPPARPLSPHLQIWKPTLSMTLSIVHRITGAALYLGTIFLVWWLVAAASGPENFAVVRAVFDSVLGQLVLFAFTWALVHHTLGGIRHLVWDTGHGLDLDSVRASGLIVVGASAAITVLIWLAAIIVR